MYGNFLVIFLLSIFFIFFVKKYALALGLIDIPNARSTHVNHTPRGAGIGFFFAIALVLPFSHFSLLFSYLWTLVAIFLIFLVGVLDDHHDTSPNTKFIIIIISAVFLSFDNILITDIGTFFGIHLVLGWFALPFTVFAVVGFTNALNLIDGLDGLSASISIVILATFYTIGYQHDDLFMQLIAGAFMVGLFAFLCFNWYPASIFMGDSGSLTLGFVIALLAVKSLVYISAVSVLFVAAIPIIDTIIVMVRRKLNGRSMFSADKCHVHHIMRGFFSDNTPKTVIFLALLQAIYSFIGLQLDKEIDEGYLLLFFILNIALLYLFFGAMLKKKDAQCS
jgi:UDP-GlcNAc:undecaprenyl-phosphate GlcNAc-1-phosphate transferase